MRRPLQHVEHACAPDPLGSDLNVSIARPQTEARTACPPAFAASCLATTCARHRPPPHACCTHVAIPPTCSRLSHAHLRRVAAQASPLASPVAQGCARNSRAAPPASAHHLGRHESCAGGRRRGGSRWRQRGSRSRRWRLRSQAKCRHMRGGRWRGTSCSIHGANRWLPTSTRAPARNAWVGVVEPANSSK